MRNVSCEGQGGRLYFPVSSSWHKLCAFVIVGLLATATGCRSTHSDATFFHAEGGRMRRKPSPIWIAISMCLSLAFTKTIGKTEGRASWHHITSRLRLSEHT